MERLTKVKTKKDEERKSPEGIILRNRQTRLNILEKIEQIRQSKETYLLDKRLKTIEIEQSELERDKLKQPSNLFNLFMATQLLVIDEAKTLIGSEPAIKNLFEENELEEIKTLILKKLRKL